MIPALVLLGLCDLVASLSLVTRPPEELPIWILGHVALCVAAGVIAARRAAQTRRDRLLMGLLFSGMAASVPLFGVGGILLLLMVGLAPVPKKPHAPWKLLRPARGGLRSVGRAVASVASLRSVLAQREQEHASERFQAVLRARDLPPRDGMAIFREALRDPSDEVRLFAF